MNLDLDSASTVRVSSVHACFVDGLNALPATMELVLSDQSEPDPLYGPCAVHVYRLQSHGRELPLDEHCTTPTSTVWRLAVSRLMLWPPEGPPAGASRLMHGWVHRGNERMLRRLICERQPRVMVEVGCWLGLCTELLLEASEPHGGCVFAIDRWDGEWLLNSQSEQYTRDATAHSMLLRGLPLYETFLVNMWEHRSRTFPLRMASIEGMETVRNLCAPVDLVYIDADHTYEAALEDIRTASRCFPNALISGDDWQWPGVRQAVEQFARESGNMKVHRHEAENWWWIETVQQRASFLSSGLGPRTGPVEFVSASVL